VEQQSNVNQGYNFRPEFRGAKGGGAVGVLRLIGIQRISQMLQDEVAKAGWLAAPAKPQPVTVAQEERPKLIRH